MTIMRKYIIGALALAFAGNAHAATNIVANGGFEDTIISGDTAGSGYQQFNAVSNGISDWTVQTNSVDLITSPYRVYEGSQALDLSGIANGTIFQTLNTVANQTYDLVFYFNHNGGETTTLSGKVSVGSLTGSTFSHTGFGWTKFSSSFVASGNDVLTFSALDTVSNGGVILDSISVSAAPEPAAWLMMIAGFGIIGASLRRKRAKLNVRFA